MNTNKRNKGFALWANVLGIVIIAMALGFIELIAPSVPDLEARSRVVSLGVLIIGAGFGVMRLGYTGKPWSFPIALAICSFVGSAIAGLLFLAGTLGMLDSVNPLDSHKMTVICVSSAISVALAAMMINLGAHGADHAERFFLGK